MNIGIGDFIPTVISIVLFSLIGSLVTHAIISCRLRNLLLNNKIVILLILFKIIYIGIVFKHNLLEEFTNIKDHFVGSGDNKNNTNNIEKIADKPTFKYKHLLLTFFYLIVLFILFKTTIGAFIIFYIIISINFILEGVKSQYEKNDSVYDTLEIVQFSLSILGYLIIIIGHIIYIGELKV